MIVHGYQDHVFTSGWISRHTKAVRTLFSCLVHQPSSRRRQELKSEMIPALSSQCPPVSRFASGEQITLRLSSGSLTRTIIAIAEHYGNADVNGRSRFFVFTLMSSLLLVLNFYPHKFLFNLSLAPDDLSLAQDCLLHIKCEKIQRLVAIPNCFNSF